MCRVARVTEARPFSVDRLPTLTEVLELGRESVVAPWPAPPTPAVTSEPSPVAPVLDEARMLRLVLADLEPRVARLLEERLREALAPALARVADGLIREVRAELVTVVRELVAQAVAQAARDSSQRL